ncbi:hypothetical protein ACWV27_27055 (plasmid) [Massilia varians]
MVAKPILVFLLAAGAAGQCQAQYASASASRALQERAAEARLDAARKTYLGRTFWVVPKPAATMRVEFREADQDGSIGSEDFVLNEPASFVVSGFATDHIESRWVQVTFKDNRVAFLRENTLFDLGPKKYPLFSQLYSFDKHQLEEDEHILPLAPAEFKLALRQRRAKDEAVRAARLARGGVKVGMNSEQVRQSSWGKPLKVNRSTGAYGVHEQWVYGEGNYIYFENGRVTSFQN